MCQSSIRKKCVEDPIRMQEASQDIIQPSTMNRNTHYGSYQVSRKQPSTTSGKKAKAKNAANQEALDKLADYRDKQQERNPNSNYAFAIKRAMKSLKDCPTPITSQKEACQLKNIGPAIAKIILPHQFSSPTSASIPPPPVATKRQRQTKLTQSPTDITTQKKKTKKEQGPTNKQKVYEKEKRAAESLNLNALGPWKVILLVDGREHKSKHVVSKCKQSGIPCEERHLPIGDMTWIAQCTNTKTEVLCGTIIERKESSDLVSSLFGTRYLEQRLRLQHCGLPQLLFLVEGDIHSNINCSAETLNMAMMETRCLGFHVIRTSHLMDTVKQLKGLHRRLVQRTFPEAFSSELPTFGASPTESIGNRRRRRPTSLLEMKFDTRPKPPLGKERFMTYQELKAKVETDREAGTRTIGAVYMAMLKQVSSLSHKKCEAIARQYPTINSLMTAFATSDSPETMLRDVPLDRQKVGPKSANELYVACCTRRDGTLPDNSPTIRSEKPAASKAPSASKPTSKAAAPNPSSSPNRDACVDLTEDTPQKPPTRNITTKPKSLMERISHDAEMMFSSPEDDLLKKNNYTYKENNHATEKINKTKRTGNMDFSSPLFSSPELKKSLPSEKASNDSSPLFSEDSLSQNSKGAVDLLDAFASKQAQDNSICVIDSSSDEEQDIPKKYKTSARIVSNTSSISGFSQSSEEGDDLGLDLRSRLAKRKKVETIEID